MKQIIEDILLALSKSWKALKLELFGTLDERKINKKVSTIKKDISKNWLN